MLLQLRRFISEDDWTGGALYDLSDNKKLLAFTLEDEKRDVKVKGETRIPAGTYEVTLRTEGGFHEKYSKKFPKMHRGMLWIRNIPNFEYVLIHIGNTDEDTAGCILVGNSLSFEGKLMDSTSAYVRVYEHVLKSKDPVWLTITDYA